KSLGAKQVVTLSYVAAAARNLLASLQLNNGIPNANISPRPNTNFNVIDFETNGPTSDYHSFQAQYQRRLSRGFQMLANYTWSHAIDSGISNEAALDNAGRGNADFDVRHNFSAAGTYDLPKLTGTGSLNR